MKMAILSLALVALGLDLGLLNGAFTPAQAQAQQRFAARAYFAGLPKVQTDSFVREAGAHAEHIYGDEGISGPPPYMGFNTAHRINTGIMDIRDAGLTTGHGSYMPKAVGSDEFIAAPGEWGQSGYRNHTSGSGFSDDGLPTMGSYGNSGNSGPGGTPDYGPPPGPGYQPATVHGVFVGWYSPEEVALSQTDFPAAFEHFVYSDRYQGSWENAMYILEVEMGRPQHGG
jgi:hypothetical protein